MELILIGALAYFFFWRRQKKKNKETTNGLQTALDYANAINQAPYLKGDGSFSQEVAGESFYEKEFKKLKNYIKQVDPGENEVVCQLVPNPNNKHDKNAVQVRAGDLQLGHLPKETAAELQQEIINMGGLVKVTGRVHFGEHNSIRLDMLIPLETKD